MQVGISQQVVQHDSYDFALIPDIVFILGGANESDVIRIDLDIVGLFDA
jgi:hypothetical protein